MLKMRHKYKRILAFMLAILMVMGVFPAPVYADKLGKEVAIYAIDSETEELVEATDMELEQDGVLYLYAHQREDIIGDIQWQIKADEELWVNIQGATAEELRVSYSMVKNLLEDDSVYLRLAVVSEDETYYSDEIAIEVVDKEQNDEVVEENLVAPDPLPAPTAVIIDDESGKWDKSTPANASSGVATPTNTASKVVRPTNTTSKVATSTNTTLNVATPANTGSGSTSSGNVSMWTRLLRTVKSFMSTEDEIATIDDDKTLYTIRIEYEYASDSQFVGKRVALPYIAEVEKGKPLNVSVMSPVCEGYETTDPDLAIVVLSYDSVNSDETITVTYSPAEVSYTVRHYKQNIDNDEYDWVETTLAKGKTEKLTSEYPDAVKSYTGFHALPHFAEKIAADSSTMIDIYYDREYYLMTFDLDEGYGVEPIYARYGSGISVPTPYKPGYTFAGWTTPIPTTMPVDGGRFTASWTSNTGISYTVAYWLENPNIEGKYDYWASFKMTNGKAGDLIETDYSDITKYITNGLKADDLKHSSVNLDKTNEANANLRINGDGSTVVNIYYDRFEYTLKFYYAMSTADKDNKVEGEEIYYVVGGSTHYFGSRATEIKTNSWYNNDGLSAEDEGDEIKLFSLYTPANNTLGYVDGNFKTPNEHLGVITSEPELKDGKESIYYPDGKKTADTVTVNNTNYEFHYISFKAKYGQDISDLWPCNVFEAAERPQSEINKNGSGWNGTAAYVSAWNGEHHVKYTLDSTVNNGNQTIKGKYSVLDENLLWKDDYGIPEDKTISYLCFWENGCSNVNWNIPRLFRYNIFIPALDGQDLDDKITETYQGKVYYRIDTYDTCDDSNVSQQTNPSLPGYKYLDKTSSSITDLTDEEKDKYKEATNVNFFYSRETYPLTLTLNDGSNDITYTDIPYGADISSKIPTSPEYSDNELKNVYKFAGWYDNSACLGNAYVLDGATMPASNLRLFAKWDSATHKIQVYQSEEDAKNAKNPYGDPIEVTHNTPVDEDDRPADPTKEGESFIGWFYRDSNKVEQAFSFATMAVTQDMVVYAKWRSSTMKEITIRYVIKNADGTETDVAAPEKMMLRVGTTRTFEAKTGNALYTDYQNGCFPMVASHSETPTAEDDSLTYSFEYKQYGSVPYNVEYYVQLDVDADGDGQLDLRPAFKKDTNGKAVFVSVRDYANNPFDFEDRYVEEHPDNNKSIVTELYVPLSKNLSYDSWKLPDDYIPNALRIQKIIVPGENNNYNDDNTIKFIYTYKENATVGLYSVNHYLQNSAKDGYYLDRFEEFMEKKDTIVSASPLSILGYTFSYDVTNTNKQKNNTLVKETDNTYTMSGKVLSDDSLELDFYYNINTYPYQIMYLEEGTNRVLLPTKTTTDGDDSTVTLRGDYGSTVSYSLYTDAEKELLADYDVDASTKSIKIQAEAGDAASINTIAFYFTRKSGNIVISKTVEKDEEQANHEDISNLPDAVLQQKFEITVSSKKGFLSSSYDYVVTDSQGGTRSGEIEADTYALKPIGISNGETLTIQNLAMGEYTVTETCEVGFKTTVDGADTTSKTVRLSSAGQTETVHFVNRYPFYTGDLVLYKSIIKCDDNDPEASGYKMKVTVQPDPKTRAIDRVITWEEGEVEKSFKIPLSTEANDNTSFPLEVNVPTGKSLTLHGVPAGDFTVEEIVDNVQDSIDNYYLVNHQARIHKSETNPYVAGKSVSSEMHGGHATTVNFKNAYIKGALELSKTVTQQYANDNWEKDTFTFKITGTTGLPDTTDEKKYLVTVGDANIPNAVAIVNDGKVSVKMVNGNKLSDPTISIRKSTGTSWTESLIIKDLPAGTYTVKEVLTDDQSSMYSCEPTNGTIDGISIGTSDGKASFTNTYNRTTGNLQIGKKIVIVTSGSKIDADQPFTFEVIPKDATLSGAYKCTFKTANTTDSTTDDTVVAGSATELSVSEDEGEGKGKLTFQLKHNQYVLIEGLPVGEYLVKENAVEGYDSSFGDVSDGNMFSVDPATIETGQTTVLNCQNSYPVYYSNLIVRKNVVTPADYLAMDRAPVDDVFTFTVSFREYSDKVDLTNGVKVKFYESENDTTPTESVIIAENNKLTFQLKHGEWVDLNLPACKYVITETGMTSTVNTSGDLSSHYTVSYTVGGKEAQQGAEFALASGEKETVVFTNTYKKHYADLTISKACSDPNQSFIFHVTGTPTYSNKSVNMKVVLAGKDSITIKELPIGSYIVQEKDSWSWRLATISDKSADLNSTNMVTFDFKNVARKELWLNGYGYDVGKYQETKGGIN